MDAVSVLVIIVCIVALWFLVSALNDIFDINGF